MSEALAVIPARGGSKRIPRKNLAVVAGKPLIVYAIEAAQQARHIHRVIVSTESPEIAEVARRFGAEVPWLRPAHLAQDDTTTLAVLLDLFAMLQQREGLLPPYAVLLEPTAPLRQPEHIDAAIEFLQGSTANSVVSVTEVPHVFNPEEMVIIEDAFLKPYVAKRTMDTRCLRGNQRPVYALNGIVYAFRPLRLLQQRGLFGETCLPLVIDRQYFLDVDVPEDLRLAEFMLTGLSQGFRADGE